MPEALSILQLFMVILYTKNTKCAIIFVSFDKKGRNMASINDGHRQRLRERMMKEGLTNFADHEILELLLFQYIPRKDTNKLAHTLINKFGSFANVLEAGPKQLMTVDGISEVTACNIAMLKEVFQRYRKSLANKTALRGASSIFKYAQRLIGESYVEKLVVVYVDGSTNFLYRDEFTSDNSNHVSVNAKDIIASAMRCNAKGVILFHCHVDGTCDPSDDDIMFTEKLFLTLAAMETVIVEHIIFNDRGDYFSFHRNGLLDEISDKYAHALPKGQ